MPITASCGNCGKTYQAPDRMAGKSVRCKACGEVFRIDAGDVGGLDLDALEASVSGEDLATHHASALHGTAVHGPALDEHGRARIERGDDVEAFNVSAKHAPGFRSNYRFRYPGAKQVDQFLPIALVLLTLVALASACMNTEANVGETPSTPVGISRLMILLAAYLFAIWPVSHIALKMASTKMRFSMPSSAAWRSFAGFMPVLLMGGWLFVKSGGAGMALAMGLLVGVGLAIGTVALLFRIFANEVPTVAGYIAVGSLGSATFAALAIYAINMIGVSVAGMDKEPTLFVSPIAIGLPWVEKPTVPVVVAKKPTTKSTKPNTTGPTVAVTPVTPPPDASTPLEPMPLPPTTADQPTMLKSLEQVRAIRPGFDEVIIPPVASSSLAIVRNANGGTVEVWNRSTWKQPTPYTVQGFDRSQGSLIVDTTGLKVLRLARYPTDRLEQLPLGNTAVMSPVTMVGTAYNRTVLGFVNDKEVLIRSGDGHSIALERYKLAMAGGVQVLEPTTITLDGKPLDVDLSPRTVRLLPDGSGILIAGRDSSVDDSPARLSLYPLQSLTSPEVQRDVALQKGYALRPVGLAVRSSGRTAMLLEFGSEVSLSVWDLRDTTKNDMIVKASAKPILDRPMGVRDALRPSTWDDAIDPLLWIDDDTILLYGKLLIDAHTGVRLSTLGVPDITGQFPLEDGSALLVQKTSGQATLVKATFDATALHNARPQ